MRVHGGIVTDHIIVGESVIDETTISDGKDTVDRHTKELSIINRLQIEASAYSKNALEAGNVLTNIYNVLSLNNLVPILKPGRTITFNNNTLSTALDLYLTVGGINPQNPQLIATIDIGNSFVWPIPSNPATSYGWNGNFRLMPSGQQLIDGTTIIEFGFNQVWATSTPDLRDTVDISTVPPGIPKSVSDGPRSAAVAASQASGFTQQQSFSYNVGVQMIPPPQTSVPPLPDLVTVICIETDGSCPDSIQYPNDVALPKTQIGDALGNYIVNLLDPVVSLP